MEIDARKALERLARERLERCVRGALDAGATAAYDLLARYPARPRGRRNPPVSPRQRRYLHWLARQGRTPYQRTGNLRQKLAIIKPAADQRVVRNTASYYPYVWGSRSRDQARIHAGIWPTRQQAQAAAAEETTRVLRRLLQQEGIV